VLKGAVARRFAEAVMGIAVQQGTVDHWLADIRLIGEVFANRRLAFVLREPNIPTQRKELVVRDLLTDKVQHDALNLALVLVHDGLTEAAPRLAQEYEQLYDDYRGQAKATVTTAMPLDAEEREKVARDLQRVTGKRIIMEERVDPSILGGVVARVGDTLIDGSVRRRLGLLREQIIKGGGPFGGPLAGPDGPDGPDAGPGGGGGAAGDGPSPFVVSPATGTDRGGPAPADPGQRPGGAAQAAPRTGDAPRMAPAANGAQGRPGVQAQAQGHRRNGGRHRGRRR
jgi:F-type H+-transporting ATPase subunit delta